MGFKANINFTVKFHEKRPDSKKNISTKYFRPQTAQYRLTYCISVKRTIYGLCIGSSK